MRGLAFILTLLAFSGSCVASETARGDREQPTSGVGSTAKDSGGRSAASTDSSPAPLPLVARPEVVRGLYVNRWAALGDRMWQLIDVAKRTEVNALVIDVKDDRGFLLYRSSVPLAREIGADTNRPMSAKRLRAIIDTMRAHDIFPIARIVVAKDPLLAQAKSEWAVKRKSDGAPWIDKNGLPWLDPHPSRDLGVRGRHRRRGDRARLRRGAVRLRTLSRRAAPDPRSRPSHSRRDACARR
jgi:hypothetical protein